MAERAKWLTPLVLVIAILVLGSYINKEVRQIQAQKIQLDYRNQLLTEAELLKTELSEGEDDRLANRDNLEEFVSSLESQAKKRGLNWAFNWTGVKKEATVQEPGTMDFSARTLGTYVNTVAFLKDLKSGAYFIRWQELSFKNIGRNYETIYKGQVFYR